MKKTAAAHEFKVVLVEEMRRRGETSRGLARALGVSHTTVRNWVLGKVLPTWSNVSLISEHLETKRISLAGHKALTKICEFCGINFVVKEARYGASKTCSQPCAKKIKSTGLRPNREVQVMNAIGDYCKNECLFGVSGSCRNSACQLAPFTPLPFAEDSMQTPTNRKPMSHKQRALRAEWSRKYWAERSSQEDRTRHSLATRAGINSMTPSQKAAQSATLRRHYATRRSIVEKTPVERE